MVLKGEEGEAVGQVGKGLESEACRGFHTLIFYKDN